MIIDTLDNLGKYVALGGRQVSHQGQRSVPESHRG